MQAADDPTTAAAAGGGDASAAASDGAAGGGGGTTTAKNSAVSTYHYLNSIVSGLLFPLCIIKMIVGGYAVWCFEKDIFSAL